MAKVGVIAVLFIICCSLEQASPQNFKLVCYFTNWSQYRQGPGRFFPEDIEPRMCTHLIYSFAFLQGNLLVPTEWNDDTEFPRGLYRRVMDLKLENPNLKILLAVGGWTMGTADFIAMASTAANRAEFVESSITYLRARNFDGLDLDWEYPAERGGTPADRDTFTALCRDLREGFERDAEDTGRERLLVTAAVAANPVIVRKGYNVPQISRYLDIINVMSYDLHGAWDRKTGFNSPLFSNPQDENQDLNVHRAAQLWNELGAPREVLAIGMPTYGRSFTLTDVTRTGLGAPTTGRGGTAGAFSGERGILLFYEICDGVQTQYNQGFDENSQVPYAYRGDQWVTFDGKESIANKMNWLMREGYGGAMVWAVDQDDFSGSVCGEKYPLMSIMNRCLLRQNGQSVCTPEDQGGQPVTPPPTPRTTQRTTPRTPPPTPPRTTPQTTQRTTPRTTPRRTTPMQPIQTTRPPVVPPVRASCVGRANGFYADPSDCRRFVICSGGRRWSLPCAPNTAYNDTLQVCDFIERVNCRQRLG